MISGLLRDALVDSPEFLRVFELVNETPRVSAAKEGI